MTGAVAIVFALRAQGEAIQAVRLADGTETIFAPGQKLMDIHLVADVPNQLVRGRIKNPVERDAQFNHSEVGSEVTAALGQPVNKFYADFIREFL